MAKRIATLFLSWSVIYLLLNNMIDSFAFGAIGPIKQVYLNFRHAINNPLMTLLEGTKEHLWFLPALLCSLLISSVLLRFELKRLLVFIAIVLYSVGLAGKAYSDTPFGFHTTFNFRDGPFFSLIFFVTGYFLNQEKIRTSWFPVGCFLLTIGMLLHFTELLFLNNHWGTSMLQDYVIGTYFLGVGVALIALSGTQWLSSSKVASVGPLVLGIYASHFVFISLLAPINRRYSGSFTWEVLYVLGVFLLSYLFALSLSKNRLTKPLVA